MPETFQVFPVGVVRKKGKATWIEIFDAYLEALLGLEGFSHIYVLYWFHENDTADKREILRVHPRKDKQNPLSGVFATHSPLRPNLIGLSVCQIKSISHNRIEIAEIDALDGSPVIDIKCLIPDPISDSDVRVPDWV